MSDEIPTQEQQEVEHLARIHAIERLAVEFEAFARSAYKEAKTNCVDTNAYDYGRHIAYDTAAQRMREIAESLRAASAKKEEMNADTPDGATPSSGGGRTEA